VKTIKISNNIRNKVVRYIHTDGTGLLNNQGLDRSKLTDDEEFELVDLMDFGLQQPPTGISGVFYFTEAGEKSHARMLDLLKKASIRGIIRIEAYYIGEPIWDSGDGQVVLEPSQVKFFNAHRGGI
jgi:hypothetical protein